MASLYVFLRLFHLCEARVHPDLKLYQIRPAEFAPGFLVSRLAR